MKYELANKLKEAGFPQPKIGAVPMPQGRWFKQIISNGELAVTSVDWTDWALASTRKIDTSFWVYIPTLTELIEACGDDFVGLKQEMTNYWRAMTDLWAGFGSTPEEAVANLWLALNE